MFPPKNRGSLIFYFQKKMSHNIKKQSESSRNTDVTFNSMDALILFPTSIIFILLLLTTFAIKELKKELYW